MPEEGMDVTNSMNPYIAQVQSSTSCLRYYCSSDEEEEATELDNSTHGDDRNELMSSRNSTRSLDSLDTLLMTLPDIVIPEPLHNPLPLQCLAAGALPDCLRKEIDIVMKQYSSASAVTSPLHTDMQQPCVTESSETGVELRKKKYERSGSIVCKAQNGVVVSIGESMCESVEESASNCGDGESCDVTLHHIKIPRRVTQLPKDNVNDLGLGFMITGGVKCKSCKVLHAIVTSVSAEVANPIIMEGVSIMEWNGTNLEDNTFEEVKVFLNKFIKSDCDQAELTVKKCSGNFILRPRQFRAEGGGGGICHLFGSWHRRKNHSRDNHMQSNEIIKTDSSPDDPFSQSLRPQSLELLDTFSNPTPNSSHSPSRSPTPENPAKSENETVEVSIPRLDSDAKALSAVMEARPKSPHKMSEGRFGANGMIQISLKYDIEMEDLRIHLNNAICQSGYNDMFINTYLIPDAKGQGARSIRVTGDDHNTKVAGGTAEDIHCYTLSETELDKSVLRVLLWDCTKGKKNVFKGEVLLSLSDMSVVTLNGQPTWLTICPPDPNLPVPPDPIHYKQQKNIKSMEQILSKLKNMKTWSRANINVAKSSSSGFLDIGPGESLRGLSILNRGAKRSTKVKTRSNGPKIMDILESEMGIANHTINEAKLAKLHSILSVLRGSEEGTSDSDASEPPPQKSTTPEFVSIFDNPAQQNDHNLTKKKTRVKKNDLSKYALRVMHEDSPDASSDSGDNLVDGNSGSFRHSMNEQSLAWLSDSSSKRKNRGKQHGRKDLKNERPRSDSFQKIPRLRESLHGGRVNRVSKYTFDDEDPLSDKQKLPSSSSPENEVGGMKASSKDGFKYHYKVQDVRDEETPSSTKTNQSQRNSNITSPDCKCYPVPVEISVHSISVVDVDKAKDGKDRIRAHSFDIRSRSHNEAIPEKSERLLKEEEEHNKTRSMSLGDVKHLKSENDEVLIVRAPFSTSSTTTTTQQQQKLQPPPQTLEKSEQQKRSSDTIKAVNPIANQKQSSSLDVDESVSSLDFKALRNNHLKTFQNRSSVDSMAVVEDGLSDSWVIVREVSNQKKKRMSRKISQDDMMGSWESVNEGMSLPKSDLMSKLKYRSMDNILDSSETSKSNRLSKNEWKNTYLHTTSTTSATSTTSHSNTDINSCFGKGVKNVGDAKVEIELNILNPKHPVVLVKLLDILFLSSKNVPSEFLMKCQLVHNSTGVCILKNKTLVNIKNPTPAAPLGLSHFQTDIINLSVEVSFFSNGLLFSKKEIGHFSIDLNSLELNKTNTTYSEWLPILKDVTS